MRRMDRCGCVAFLLDVIRGTLEHLRAIARVALSCLLTLALLLSVAVPALVGGVSLAARHLANLAWSAAVRMAWTRLAAAAPGVEDFLPSLLALTPNTTAADEPPAFFYEAMAGLGGAQVTGSTWAWTCLAVIAGRGLRNR